MSSLKSIKGLYNIPHEVLEDISLYSAEVERFLKGELAPERFKPFRVARGIYAQRGQETYMVRIKVPAGGLTPRQMDVIAELSKRYGNGIPHVTARQDVQLHWVKIEDTVKCMRGLSEVGLTTKGGGGNTVRNITACPDSGVCDREAFDVAPYAIALTEYYLTHPRWSHLPRKFKIAFSGCSDDCALATINDVGFIAVKRSVDGGVQEGFRMYAAGGMGAWSRVATLMEDFVPADEVLYYAEAVRNIFDKHGNRRNKHKARLRFVIERFGEDEFRRMLKKEVERLKEEGLDEINLRPVPKLRDPLSEEPKPVEGAIEDEGYKLWRRTNVRPQKQEGFYYAKIRLDIGDITAEKFKALANVVRSLGEGTVRTTQDQNLVIRWLREEELPALYLKLKELELSEPRAGGIDDVLCCPGASTCNLGICLSRHMSPVIKDELQKSGLDLERLHDVDIKISGCPNSCGQHPIGAIGLHGAARRSGERMAPHYEVLVGGRVEEGRTRLAEPLGFVPAKNIPSLLKDFLSLYLEERKEDEDFHAYIDRRGRDDLKSFVSKWSRMPDYEEDRSYYIDWGAEEEFSLAGLGPGECGAGMFDMIEADMDDARKHIKMAEELLDKGANASEDLFKALVLSAKALLITRGLEPAGDFEALKAFEESFIEKGLAPERFSGLEKKGAAFFSGLLDEKGQRDGLAFVKEFFDAIEKLYESMDDNMKFPGEKEAAAAQVKEKGAAPEGADEFMDLRGVKCPINYVKAKIKLETMDVGKTLLLYLDEGEPIRNVPSSLKNDGQEILRMEKRGEYYELLVKKNV